MPRVSPWLTSGGGGGRPDITLNPHWNWGSICLGPCTPTGMGVHPPGCPCTPTGIAAHLPGHPTPPLEWGSTRLGTPASRLERGSAHLAPCTATRTGVHPPGRPCTPTGMGVHLPGPPHPHWNGGPPTWAPRDMAGQACLARRRQMNLAEPGFDLRLLAEQLLRNIPAPQLPWDIPAP